MKWIFNPKNDQAGYEALKQRLSNQHPRPPLAGIALAMFYPARWFVRGAIAFFVVALLTALMSR
jgi:hypothetical protein